MLKSQLVIMGGFFYEPFGIYLAVKWEKMEVIQCHSWTKISS